MSCCRSRLFVPQRDDLAPYNRDEDDAGADGGGASRAPAAAPLGPAAGGFEMSTKIAALLRGLAACERRVFVLVLALADC
jgi:hypothetical protein